MSEEITDKAKDLQRFEEAQTKLGLIVRENKQDVNVLWVRGKPENLKSIFEGIFNGLDSKKHPAFEIERGWNIILDGQQLRPGGTYMVTIKMDRESQQPEMIVMNVNARDYQPIVDEMHDVVKQSIIKASEVVEP
jgi:hypothetical protein